MTHVRGHIVIDRPVEQVFDLVADERNEPSYNPAMTHVEKLTQGPIGTGTRYRATVSSMGRPVDMLIETTTYERPTVLASTTTMAWASIRGTLTFEADAGLTRLSWDWDVAPTGPSRMLGPLVGLVGRRQEGRIWAGLKHRLETTADED